MLFFKPEKYKGSKKGISYNILVSKREKEGKKGKRERRGEERERKKENIHIRLGNSNGRKNTKGN